MIVVTTKILKMAGFTIGSRVYLSSLKMFGDVVKTRSLGTTAVVVQCDDGVLRVVCGKSVHQDVVDKSTSKNGNGDTVQLPADVRLIGPQILANFGVDEQKTPALFQKFMVLNDDVRLNKANYWEANKDDEDKMSDFLNDLLSILGEDTRFVQQKSANLLRKVDQDVRDTMLTTLMTSTTSTEREAMIMQYTLVQNDKVKAGEFLEQMFEVLLDNQDYIKAEFKRALSRKRIYGKESTAMIAGLLANTTEEEQTEIVRVWREKKYYRSKSSGNHAYSVIKRYSTHSTPES